MRGMAGLAARAGLAHLIAPVRPSQKERYPTIPIERYTRWTEEDGTPFDPVKNVPIETRNNAGCDLRGLSRQTAPPRSPLSHSAPRVGHCRVPAPSVAPNSRARLHLTLGAVFKTPPTPP